MFVCLLATVVGGQTAARTGGVDVDRALAGQDGRFPSARCRWGAVGRPARCVAVYAGVASGDASAHGTPRGERAGARDAQRSPLPLGRLGLTTVGSMSMLNYTYTHSRDMLKEHV